MPQFDTTGPRGRGPRTGRGFGPCGMGCGWGKHFGPGRGMGRYFGWDVPQTKEERLQALADYRVALEEEFEDIKKEEAELRKND
ncbi:MAG TPA: DUF5320 family protein [Candidatus Paceibacterota bacterium]|nr:DUF5320 family protein [Candidatus Paceibacterota bacterium]